MGLKNLANKRAKNVGQWFIPGSFLAAFSASPKGLPYVLSLITMGPPPRAFNFFKKYFTVLSLCARRALEELPCFLIKFKELASM
ncbi:MAG: hypothetical protein ACP5Q3_06420 [bacterium]